MRGSHPPWESFRGRCEYLRCHPKKTPCAFAVPSSKLLVTSHIWILCHEGHHLTAVPRLCYAENRRRKLRCHSKNHVQNKEKSPKPRPEPRGAGGGSCCPVKKSVSADEGSDCPHLHSGWHPPDECQTTGGCSQEMMRKVYTVKTGEVRNQAAEHASIPDRKDRNRSGRRARQKVTQNDRLWRQVLA